MSQEHNQENLNVQQDPNMDVTDLAKQAMAQQPTLPPVEEEVVMDPETGEHPSIVAMMKERNIPVERVAYETVAPTQSGQLGEALPEEEEEGRSKGIVLNAADLTDLEAKQPKPPGEPVSHEDGEGLDTFLDSINEEHLAEKEEVIRQFVGEAGVKQMHEQLNIGAALEKPKPADEEEETEEDAEAREEAEIQKEYDELAENQEVATVLIDKLGSSIFKFTPEQEEKLERAKVIRVKEVDDIELKTIRTRRPKGKDAAVTINKRRSRLNTTPVVLPMSGYTASMGGASAHELLALAQSMENPLLDTQTRWSLLYDKLHDPSIPMKNFTQFLSKTAFSDYEMMVYGVLCSTYPDEDIVSLTCTKCEKDYEHKYTPRSLLRYEELAKSEKLQQLVAGAVESSLVVDRALAHHDSAPVNSVRRVRLPDSQFILELYTQSAHDFIEKSVKSISENSDSRQEQALILATMVSRILVPDFESDPNDPFYDEFDTPADIAQLIYGLRDTDILMLAREGERTDDSKFTFGFTDVVCSHCGNRHATYPIEIENILFLRFQQATSTDVE